MHFEIIGDIEDVETLAVGGRIRDIMRIQNSLVPDGGVSSRGWPRFVFKAEGYAMLRCTGVKRTALAERK
ncbi:MAG TPA: hypothetical protein VMW89_00010 [Desulfatiglandales bacterium]|nr:hypothetical protein [Desulfatiglandales bacterium]